MKHYFWIMHASIFDCNGIQFTFQINWCISDSQYWCTLWVIVDKLIWFTNHIPTAFIDHILTTFTNVIPTTYWPHTNQINLFTTTHPTVCASIVWHILPQHKLYVPSVKEHDHAITLLICWHFPGWHLPTDACFFLHQSIIKWQCLDNWRISLGALLELLHGVLSIKMLVRGLRKPRTSFLYKLLLYKWLSLRRT